MNLGRAYAMLLRLYPRAFREQYGAEITRDFKESLQHAQARGPAFAIQEFLHAIFDLMHNAFRQRLHLKPTNTTSDWQHLTQLSCFLGGTSLIAWAVLIWLTTTYQPTQLTEDMLRSDVFVVALTGLVTILIPSGALFLAARTRAPWHRTWPSVALAVIGFGLACSGQFQGAYQGFIAESWFSLWLSILVSFTAWAFLGIAFWRQTSSPWHRLPLLIGVLGLLGLSGLPIRIMPYEDLPPTAFDSIDCLPKEYGMPFDSRDSRQLKIPVGKLTSCLANSAYQASESARTTSQRAQLRTLGSQCFVLAGLVWLWLGYSLRKPTSSLEAEKLTTLQNHEAI